MEFLAQRVLSVDMTILRKLLFLHGLAASSSVFALPVLQLDVLGGTYVGGSEETTFANSSTFVVRALLKTGQPLTNYYLSAGILPGQMALPLPDVGSFSIDGTLYTTATLNYGDPPLNVPDIQPGDLAPHGVYPTYYVEVSFNFSGATVGAYNTADGTTQAGSLLYYHDFSVNVSGLRSGYSVHFDLYDEKVKQGNYVVDDFAPFSHDAQSRLRVPDNGSTVLLMGIALILLRLATWRRR